jgi:superfamily II DNA or RNA helicase
MSCRLAAVSKTVLFSRVANNVSARGKRVGIFAHRVELLDQISRTLDGFGVAHGRIDADTRRVSDHGVQVVSAATYSRRINSMPIFDVGIIDEAHHVKPDNTWHRCMMNSENAVWLGVTATPQRLDGTGLGQSFTTMVQGPGPRELIEAGYLSKYVAFAPPCRVDLSSLRTVAGDYNLSDLAQAVDVPSITGDAVAHYRKHLDGRPAIAFCVSVAHAQHVADHFRYAGYSAKSIDGSMDKQVRAEIMAEFRAGDLQVLTSCEIVSEGLDVPGVHGAILLRPTQSLGLYMQQVGRALRLCDGKDRAIILDHAGNTSRHGLPDDHREWSLEDRPKRKKGDGCETVKQCRSCYAAYSSDLSACPECGYAEPGSKPREIELREGELVEVTSRAEAMRRQGQASSLAELMAQGNSKHRALHILAARAQKEMLRNRVLELVPHINPQALFRMKPAELKELIAEIEQ